MRVIPLFLLLILFTSFTHAKPPCTSEKIVDIQIITKSVVCLNNGKLGSKRCYWTKQTDNCGNVTTKFSSCDPCQ